MASIAHHHTVALQAAFDPRQLMLDQGAIDAGRRLAHAHDLTTSCGHWRDDVIGLLEDSLAIEMMCVMNFISRRQAGADEPAAPEVADDSPARFGEFSHAVRLAQHIVRLGGRPHFSPHPTRRLGHAGSDDAPDLDAMVRVNLAVERVAIERYTQIITRVGRKNSASRRLIETVLDEEEAHAEELEYWLAH